MTSLVRLSDIFQLSLFLLGSHCFFACAVRKGNKVGFHYGGSVWVFQVKVYRNDKINLPCPCLWDLWMWEIITFVIKLQMEWWKPQFSTFNFWCMRQRSLHLPPYLPASWADVQLWVARGLFSSVRFYIMKEEHLDLAWWVPLVRSLSGVLLFLWLSFSLS